MYPQIRNNDYIFITRINMEKILIGNIVVCFIFDRKGSIVAHRVVKINPNYVIIKGDNQLGSALKIEYKNILGKVRQVVRGIKFIDLESPFYNFYGKAISYLSFYASCLLFFLFKIRSFFDAPCLFLGKSVRFVRRYINWVDSKFS